MKKEKNIVCHVLSNATMEPNPVIIYEDSAFRCKAHQQVRINSYSTRIKNNIKHNYFQYLKLLEIFGNNGTRFDLERDRED